MSIGSQVHPSPQSAVPDAAGARPRRRVWGFFGTLLWGGAIYLAFNAAQIGALLLLIRWRRPDLASADIGAFVMQGVTLSAVTLAALPVVLGTIALAVRMTATRLSDYLALRSFGWRDLAVGFGLIVLFLPLVSIAALLTGRPVTPPVVVETYTSARDAGALALLVLAVCVVGPISEEFAVRGFLMRGWETSRIGGAGAVVLTAALWAVMHVQYEWFFVGEIFGTGLIFGYMRLRSGSTWLTVVLHGTYNVAALIQAAVVDRLG